MAWPINVIQLCEENTENVRNKRERRTEAKSSHKFGTWNKPLYIRNLGAAQPQSVQNMRDRELFSQFMHICGCPEREIYRKRWRYVWAACQELPCKCFWLTDSVTDWLTDRMTCHLSDCRRKLWHPKCLEMGDYKHTHTHIHASINTIETCTYKESVVQNAFVSAH